MKRALWFFWVLISGAAAASTITIGIFNDVSVNSVLLGIEKGNYTIVLDSSTKITANINSVYRLMVVNDSISLKTMDKDYGKFLRIDFLGDDTSALKLKCINPNKAAKIYTNDFSFFIVKEQLISKNKVDLEKYVAGVVEAEAGTRQSLEYYKVQAIICRTYALSNLRRHEEDKFNLCDNVHCQVYKGSNNLNPEIGSAAFQTHNLVLVDKKSELITTAFHSNCGGQTCNSEDVWGLSKPYLRSVNDTFCLRQRNAVWKKVISKEQWNEYLAQNGNVVSGDSDLQSPGFTQQERKIFMETGQLPIPLKKIRTDFKLKSTFFSIQQENDSLVFSGRGYGHGVGLCQEGAIQMAKMGLRYNFILHYYYREVDIINLNQLHFFKD